MPDKDEFKEGRFVVFHGGGYAFHHYGEGREAQVGGQLVTWHP